MLHSGREQHRSGGDGTDHPYMLERAPPSTCSRLRCAMPEDLIPATCAYRGVSLETVSPWARQLDTNPLRSPDDFLFDLRDHPRTSAWTGTFATELFGDEPKTWGPAGWASFEQLCERAEPMLVNAGRELCWRPHARHVLSDIPSCRRFLARWAGSDRPMRLVLDPASMLTDSMLPDASDHVARVLESLLGETGVAAVLLPCDAAGSPRPAWIEGADGLIPPHIPIVHATDRAGAART